MASAQTDSYGPHRKLDEILAAYLEEAEAGRAPDRRAWLAKHPDLAPELADFFENLDRMSQLAEPIWAGPGDATRDVIPFPIKSDEGTRIGYFGDYELIRELGRGGMGVVYAARQASLDRVLALKLLSPARPGTEADLLRFEREAIAAAGLDHPNIVPIYEVGEHDGRHYYGMKLIDGGSLAQHVARLRDDPRTAAALLAQVARAVHYAHQRGVLHRDLKPANVLLDRQERPYVVDFGLARRVEESAGMTASGSVLGTPAYMAPEQAEGRREAVTTATDVYGLGAILYELLTGQPPFPGDSILDVLARVRESDPESPSRLNRKAPRDLGTIALKCLEKLPKRRYPTAESLAEDLERWLAGSPIAARPTNIVERTVKWARRRPAGAALLVTALFAAGAAVVAVQGFRSAKQLQHDLDTTIFAQAEATPEEYAIRIAAAEQAWKANHVREAERLLDQCPATVRGWEWYYLKRQCHAERLTFRGHTGSACGVAFAPASLQFTCATEQGLVTIWDAATNQSVQHLRGPDGMSHGVAFDQLGERLATAGVDGAPRIWDVRTGALLRTFPSHGDWASGVAFNPDGDRLVSSGADGIVKVWDTKTGAEILRLSGHSGPVFGVAFSPDGKAIAGAGGDGVVIVWNARSGKETRRLSGSSESVHCVAFAPDGSRLAAGGADRVVRIWDLKSGQEVTHFVAAMRRVDGVAFSPDGKRLATGSLDASVKIWDADSYRELASYRGHAAPVFSVAFSPNGSVLASASQDATVKLWDATSPPEARTFFVASQPVRFGSVAYLPGANELSASGVADRLLHWDLETAERRAEKPDRALVATSIVYGRDGRLLAVADADGLAHVGDAVSGEIRWSLKPRQSSVASVALFPDGSKLVTGDGRPAEIAQEIEEKGMSPSSGQRSVRVWDLATGRELFALGGHVGYVYAVAVSPDGTRIASGGHDGTVRLWDAAKQTEVSRIVTDSGPILTVAFSPDGAQLAFAGRRGRVRLRELASGTDGELAGNEGIVSGLAFSPDGSRLAVGGGDGVIRIWDPHRKRELLRMPGHEGRILSVAFHPRGNSLASVGVDGAVKVWDALTDGRR
jgi:WD40 repeat protein/predicted Ser/Thr protein kinase